MTIAGSSFGMEDHLLGVGLLVGDDAGAADFRAGAGGGRHRDDRRDRVGIGARPPVADILEIPDRPRLSGLEGDQLAEVERRAAAEGDDAVMLALLEGGDAGGQVGLDRVGLHLGKHRMRHLGVAEDLQRARDDRQLGKPGIGDEQRPLDAGGSEHLRQFGNAPRAEADGGRVVPFGNELGHVCFLSVKMSLTADHWTKVLRTRRELSMYGTQTATSTMRRAGCPSRCPRRSARPRRRRRCP